VKNRVVSAFGAAGLIAVSPLTALAADPHAPPTLTPLVAQSVAATCPGTAKYADALVRGITDADALVAAPLFDACAAGARRDFFNWSNELASTAVGAVYLSRGLLNNNDPALLQRAIDATARLRSRNSWPDELVRQWPIIPDEFDARRREAIIRLDCPSGTWVADATYINVAARSGAAWITVPRDPTTCTHGRYAASHPDFNEPLWQRAGPDPHQRPNPAIDPGLNGPVRPTPP
jgi:hypothetical protein